MQNTINGFVRTRERTLINDNGEILLKGWGIGNWLLYEGYMWESEGSERMDRHHRIEMVLKELLGKKAAQNFLEEFQSNYFSQKDVAYIKQLGYNSIRLPIHWALFLEDEPEVHFKEEGFSILNNVIEWCTAEDVYLLLDLHGAPGGQTGENIDDSIDNIPRLFTDADKFEKGLALWEEIARRYHHETTIAGFDLLNEPLCKEFIDNQYLVPKLAEFYEKAIQRIRKYDRNHLIALEGHNWATNTAIFNQFYDENYIIQFHRYAVYPEMSSFKEYLELANQWNVPLWLGETGENKKEWFSAITQICEDNNISYHFWPYKKMNSVNGSLGIKSPTEWSKIISYSKGGKHPGYERAKTIFEEFAVNMLFENNIQNKHIDEAILRNGPYTLRATDFSEREGTFGGYSTQGNLYHFRKNLQLDVFTESEVRRKEFLFDTQWDSFKLRLRAGEFISYHSPNFNANKLLLRFDDAVDCLLEINKETFHLNGSGEEVISISNYQDLISVECTRGFLTLDQLRFE